MAKIEHGILGGFSGKVGTVIGGTWKGIDFMRSKSKRRNFVPTQKQLEQQVKFALIMRFVQPMSALLEVTFVDYAVRKTVSTVLFRTSTTMRSQAFFRTLRLITQKYW